MQKWHERQHCLEHNEQTATEMETEREAVAAVRADAAITAHE